MARRGRYANRWVLLRTVDNRWVFGKIYEYNSTTMRILAFYNVNVSTFHPEYGEFHYIDVPMANISEAWIVSQWVKFIPLPPGETFNWYNYINRWALFYNFHRHWTFGKLTAYNPSTNEVNILALINGKFRTITYPQASLIEGWYVKSWVRIR
ncbi:hypothetical protein M6D81_01490 [Paenibacillus sp. J5C_2022]|uniref:hypothetical protein n=1 Tax=Paenibacillus sp. J5C2022 TaxID=2977129 RepID=UPI0021CE7D98|nr:hypothetical protein [Paenibacillus sp. J5C2022]MCU6707368.1 hypothetical protein [Paenibacillus sp. J5C2022]